MAIQNVRVKTKFKAATNESVELERRSDGFSIRVALDLSKSSKRPEALKSVKSGKSGLEFVDSLLYKMPDFCVKIEVEEVGSGAERAEIIKNAGFAFGEGLRKLIEKRKAKGCGSSIHSDEKAMCMFAISAGKQPGEANLQIIGTPERGFDPEHFFAFFDGLAQGMGVEISAVVNLGNAKGSTKKSQMEFVSKTFASSLKQIIG